MKRTSLIEITGVDLVEFISAVRNIPGLHPLPKWCIRDELERAWADYQELKEVSFTAYLRNRERMGLIKNQSDRSHYLEQSVKEARGRFNHGYLCLYSTSDGDYPGCNLTILVQGYERHRLFIEVPWDDHSQEQLSTLLKRFNLQ